MSKYRPERIWPRLIPKGSVMVSIYGPDGHHAYGVISISRGRIDRIYNDSVMAPERTYRIKQYPLETGSLEIEYLEEFFGEFNRKKRAKEIQDRLAGREHCILMAVARLPEEPSQLVPVSFKVGHELFAEESEPKFGTSSSD